MFRKMSLWIGILIVFCLPFAQNVAAQTPPPAGTPAPQMESSVKPANHAGQPPSRVPTNHAAAAAAASSGSALNLNGLSPDGALTLGAPGTSFRLERMYGETETPYFADTAHLLQPGGLFIDADDNLYVTEEEGYRVLRYDANGQSTLALGRPGVAYHGSGDDIAFANPHDVAEDATGNIWVIDDSRLIEFDSTGTYLRQLPEVNPWETGSDNTHFNYANGLAIDNANHRLFVADTNNHRVQVYDITSGAPVWQATIGSDGPALGQFREPRRVAVDGTGSIYVTDAGNNRVQRCTYNSGTDAWDCALFLDTLGDRDLAFPVGLTYSDVGTPSVYIADSYNYRVIRCTAVSTPVCTTLISDIYPVTDLAVDSSGNVYLASNYFDIVGKFDPSGEFLGLAAGVWSVPYLADNNHYNQPHVAVDASDNLLIIENSGQRLTKLNAQGVWQWNFGVTGHNQWMDSKHLDYPYAAAADQAGNIYVSNGSYLSVLDKNGSFLRFMADGWQEGGNEQWFSWISAVAVDKQNHVYLTDTWNSRVVVFNTDGTYVATIGGPNPGTGNNQFYNPQGLEVDAAGNLYVADTDNCRIQKFNSSRVYVTTFGVTGACDDTYPHLLGPQDIAVDALGRVYTTSWDNRIRIFDSNGKFLTTVGSQFGGDSEATRGTPSIAVDSKFNIYLGDSGNGRVKKYAPMLTGWRQINLNGFDQFSNQVPSALELFNGKLYSATYNYNMGTRVWRLNGATWEPVSSYRFGETGAGFNVFVTDMAVYGGKLYASTGWGDNPGEIWSSPDGVTWTQETGNFNNANNSSIYTFTIYNNMLFVSTFNTADGVEIWRKASPTGSWDAAPIYKAADTNDISILDFKVFGGYLYAGVENSATGMKVIRSQDGSTWEPTSFVNGYDDADNLYSAGMAVFNGYLYMGTVHRGKTGTGELWRTPDGSTWEEVTPNNPWSGSGGAGPLIAVNGSLYFFMNSDNGVRVFASTDGENWKQVNIDGFGSISNNDTPLANNGVLLYQNKLTAGIWNERSGGSIWQLVPDLYLPVVTKH